MATEGSNTEVHGDLEKSSQQNGVKAQLERSPEREWKERTRR